MNKYILNKAQTEAVVYTAGPLLIVAGAGTGKTTVIAKKIANLLQSGVATADQILALTFTDKAAEEMYERVDNSLEVGYSDLTVSTFHAFCQHVLEHHAIDIGLSSQFKVLSQSATWILVKENFEKFKLNYYRPLGNPTKHITELLKHFSKCKDELVSPKEYLEYAQNLKLNKDNAVKEEKSRLTEIADAYHTYNQLLLNKAAFDFGDLIYYTVELFKRRPKVLKAFHDRYKFILVDEFQDVNWAQYELIKLLTTGGAQLTVVGDDDQSIYAFRGASVSNIMHFKEDYPKAKEIVLKENYRSGQNILDAAYKLIKQNNPDRLEVKLNINKKLAAASALQSKVIHINQPDLTSEVALTIKQIVDLKNNQENLNWGDLAILVRANNHAEPFIKELEKQSIPYEFLSSTGLYKQPIVIDCLSYFRVIDNYHENGAIFRLLTMPFFGFKENDLQRITYSAKRKSISYYEALKRSPEFNLSTAGVHLADKLIELIHLGMKKTRYEKPSTILYNFLDQTGYLTYLTKEEGSGNNEVIRQIYQLKQFFDYLEEYETLNSAGRINDFLEQFSLLIESGERGGFLEPKDASDSVNIMTVHGSKGLEFKYVFIVNLVEERFPLRQKSAGIELPDQLINEQLPEGNSHYQEERRLFYVALTRAQIGAYLTSANDYGGVRKKKISRFLAELGYQASKPGLGAAVPRLANNKQTANEEKFIFDLPKAFSFSQINSYETCPYQYKLAHLLRIPTKGKASFSFGQTMHSTLQNFYGKVQQLNSVKQKSLFTPNTKLAVNNELKIPSLNELLSIYENCWIDDWYNNKIEKNKYYSKGKEILKLFYQSHDGNWTIPAGLESWFKIKVGDYFINGRIDRLDLLNDNTIEIIDYKTGKSKEKLTSADKEQLLMYQIAVQELPVYRNIGKPSKLTFYYLNDNLKTSFIGKNEEILKLKDKLVASIDKIQTRNFSATPSKFACQNCDFKDICEFRV